MNKKKICPKPLVSILIAIIIWLALSLVWPWDKALVSSFFVSLIIIYNEEEWAKLPMLSQYQSHSNKIGKMSQALVAHYCNSSYLGDYDREGHVLKPAWTKSLWDPISTNSWLLWCTPVILAIAGSIKIGGPWSRPVCTNRKTLFPK
jgi:hypothetical protein